MQAISSPEPGVSLRQTTVGDTFFVSPPGAPDPYGHLPPLRVRTVGFGLLPVEATVQVSQRRANGLPIPIRATLGTDTLDDGTDVNTEAHVDDAFEVRITQVLVDGVDLGIGPNCRTIKPAPVQITSPRFIIPQWARSDPEGYLHSLDPATYYHPFYGGQLQGTIDMPHFSGCVTKSGDDVSPMITLSVSGPSNRVVFRARACDAIAGEQGESIPLQPGQYEPEAAGCPAPLEQIPYPERGSD